ncbi:MAG TPA: peroxiredoxin [Candidatus Caldiarchaeum subterraneum]|uniref:Peroxiredoxin n=1 Tax=Caldiarchaeum subterraneum TaxID=311458 RepID=A0A832ZY38_CALS0|nr:peroxiredoxin [Aigarchaeota archaeon]HIQ30487.1 peroxiredoxin [Candidatus Caldarchaeum subterraneum]
MPEVGEKAPDFTLPDQERRMRSLSEFKGRKVVLAFFPGAFTSVCTKEMCTFRDSMSRFNDLDAVVLGISVNDPFTQKAFAEANNLNFTLLSDYNRETVKKYNVYHENFVGLNGYTAAKRAVFIIDREGVIKYKWVSDDPLKEPNYDEIIAELSKIS